MKDHLLLIITTMALVGCKQEAERVVLDCSGTVTEAPDTERERKYPGDVHLVIRYSNYRSGFAGGTFGYMKIQPGSTPETTYLKRPDHGAPVSGFVSRTSGIGSFGWWEPMPQEEWERPGLRQATLLRSYYVTCEPQERKF